MPNHPSLADSYQGEFLTLRDVLETPGFTGTEILAGASGLDRVVSSVNVMENPTITPWVKGRELLITVGYSLSGADQDLASLINDLADLDLAGFGVKLGPFITEVTAAALGVADRRGFPILSLPPAVSFDDLISDVYRARGSLLLGGIHRRSDREQELMTVALAGGGLAEIAERLAHLTSCEVLVLGPGNDVVAHLMADDAVPGSGHNPLAGSPVDDAVTAPIVVGSTYVGSLYVFPSRGPTAGFFPGLVPTSARIMALAASREIAVSSVDRQFRAEFLEQLLQHRLDDRDVTRRSQALDWAIEYPAAIVSLSPADLDAAPYLERARDALGFSLRARGLRSPHAIINGTVVAIVGGESSAGSPEVTAAEAAKEVIAPSEPGSWSAGISGRIEDPSGLAKGWDQARTAAAVARTIHGVGTVASFTGLGVFRLLSEIDPAVLEDFASDALGELYEPSRAQRELRDTLSALLDANLNTAATAKAIGYHYNTIRYRTHRLEQILGPFLTDPARRLELQIALLISDMAPMGDTTRRR